MKKMTIRLQQYHLKASSQEQAQAGATQGSKVAEATAGTDNVTSEEEQITVNHRLTLVPLDNGDISSCGNLD